MSNVDNLHILTETEADVIGEVMNISMGAAATAMSTILDKKVSITTPRIKTQPASEFEISHIETMTGVLIDYIEGIEGSNILLLKESDLKIILGHMLSMEPSEILEFDEISTSVICEIMNQMMGSASSALATFLGKGINISPPKLLDTTENIKELFIENGDSLVVIKFNLSIDGLIESEFISLMQPKLAREIIKMSYGVSDMEEEVKLELEPEPEPELEYELELASESELGSVMEFDSQTANTVREAPSIAQEPKETVYAAPYEFKSLVSEKKADVDLNQNNLDLIMSVPIQITVELGKTRKKIKDIAELTVGNIVELNRQAGDQVDVVANGKLIAKGDVVVVDDNYSVRITEIVKARDMVHDFK